MTPAIALSGITKEFELWRERPSSLKAMALSFRRPTTQRLMVLNGIQLRVEHGESVAVIGRNGSGKSTLLRIIGRVYLPTSGSVEVNGRMSTMLDLGAGFHPELTGRENIFFNGAIMGLSIRQIRERIGAIIEFSELGDFIDSPVKTYSAGMEMRLGFAVATETDPDILLIDEVLAVGDAEFQQKCYDRIDEFKRTGKTIVFVTHDLTAARSVASRTVWIQDGAIRVDGSTEQTISAYLASLPRAHDGGHER